MKAMLIHEKGCVITAKGGCFTCKRIWALLHDHVEQCTVEECHVPHCVAIRERGCDGRGRKVFFFWVDAKGWRGDGGKRETTIRADRYLSGSVQPAVVDVDQAKQAKLGQ